jgi:hypothetical protein
MNQTPKPNPRISDRRNALSIMSLASLFLSPGANLRHRVSPDGSLKFSLMRNLD